MIIKSKFELVYNISGGVYNVVPLTRGTLRAYEAAPEDYSHVQSLVRAYSRMKRHPAGKIIEKYIDSCVIVNMPSYPLPGFVTRKGLAVVNLNPLASAIITDFTPFDIFSLFLYTISLRAFTVKKPFKKDNMISVYLMIFSIFMRLFGKKAGLIGSYAHLIPKLRFLIMLYVGVSMFGLSQDDKTKQRLASTLYIDYKELKLDYDFTSVKDFLKAINENNIISLSEHTFSTFMINRAGISSLPVFEDASRFYATMIASTIYGSTLFSGFYHKANSSLYPKIVDIGLKTLGRIS